MTEAEWLTCEDDPLAMLYHLETEARRWFCTWEGDWWPRRVACWVRGLSPAATPWRKEKVHRRLYLLACGMRRLWATSLPDGGEIPKCFEIEEQFADGRMTFAELLADDPERRWWWSDPWHLVSSVARTRIPRYPELMPLDCRLFRDVFGNPFRPVVANPSWRTSTIVGLADAIYADRAFDRLPILADALEEAGCDNADLLAHCRGDGPHVRGCWAVDLVLGKGWL